MKNKGFALVPLLISLGVVGSLVAGILGYNLKEKLNLGATIPVSNALIDTYLSIGIDNAVTSMTLANGTTRDGVTLSGYNCFTIDANTPTVEYVCGTASGTSITGMTRGISMSNPNATTTAYAHRRFASVQSTDYPQIAILSRILNGTDTVPNLLTYNNKVLITGASASTTIATKYYVDGVAIAGAPDATTGVKGISQKATALQVASSTDIGSTGASLFIPASNATSTYNVATAPLKVVVTDNSGKIDGNFLDMSENYTFAGQNTFTATSTMASTTFNGSILNKFGDSIIKFGGSGEDGALVISSGTTTINLMGASVFTKNYTSISITGTGGLAFSNPASGGTSIVLKSQGDVILTSTAIPFIDLSGLVSGSESNFIINKYNLIGAAGGNNCLGGGGGAGELTSGSNGSDGLAGGARTTASTTALISSKILTTHNGAGGASGGTSGGTGGTGGNGGNGLIFEIGGSLTFSGTIWSKGNNGTNASGNCGGGGGGGGGGSVVMLYNNLISNTGTFVVTGGSGGAGATGGGNGGAGGTGVGLVIKNYEF